MLIADCEHKTAPQARAGSEFGYSIGTPSLRRGRILLDSAKRVDRATFDEWTRRGVPQTGDLILAREAPVGQVGFVSGDVPLCLGQRTVLIRPDVDSINPRYLQYRLLGPAVQQWMTERASGSTVPHLNVEDVREIDLGLLPTRFEQDAVAEMLGALDEKVENCNSVALLADEIFRVDWERRFGERQAAPSSMLSELCSTQYGYTASATTDPVGPKFLRVMDINKVNWIDWSNVPFCGADDGARSRYGLREGDIVVARMADPGQAALVEEPVDAIFASYLVRLTLHHPKYSRFIYGFLKSRHYRAYAAAHTGGSVQRNMNAKVIVGVPLALPTDEELADFEKSAVPLREAVAGAVREANALTQLRDVLLPALMSGELRVRDAKSRVGEAV